jgi:predicted RNA-binding protein with RPS1 domain
MPIFIVSTVTVFKHKYVIEADDEASANKEVEKFIINVDEKHDLDELSQRYMAEHIISTEKVNQKELIELCDKENPYLKNWNKSQKLRFINKAKK